MVGTRWIGEEDEDGWGSTVASDGSKPFSAAAGGLCASCCDMGLREWLGTVEVDRPAAPVSNRTARLLASWQQWQVGDDTELEGS